MQRPPRIFAAIVLLVAIAFLYGGVGRAAVGGSRYYVLAGIALLASAILLWRGNKLGSHIYGALLAVTLLWSLFEVGTDLWALAPRLGLLAILGAWLLTPFARRRLYSPQQPPALLASARSQSIAAASALTVVAVFIVGSRNTADELTPRHVPLKPTGAIFICGSNSQRFAPVSASSATTTFIAVHTYSISPICSGVALNWPARPVR